jgi:hypothetical protein
MSSRPTSNNIIHHYPVDQLSSAMSDVISDDTSKRMCAHMNVDHAASVHGMVLSCIQRKGAAISDAKMVSISMEGCQLKYVACKGDVCEMNNVFMPFDPPLKSVKESR